MKDTYSKNSYNKQLNYKRYNPMNLFRNNSYSISEDITGILRNDSSDFWQENPFTKQKQLFTEIQPQYVFNSVNSVNPMIINKSFIIVDQYGNQNFCTGDISNLANIAPTIYQVSGKNNMEPPNSVNYSYMSNESYPNNRAKEGMNMNIKRFNSFTNKSKFEKNSFDESIEGEEEGDCNEDEEEEEDEEGEDEEEEGEEEEEEGEGEEDEVEEDEEDEEECEEEYEDEDEEYEVDEENNGNKNNFLRKKRACTKKVYNKHYSINTNSTYTDSKYKKALKIPINKSNI